MGIPDSKIVSDSRDTWKRIGWNNTRISCPAGWEAVVSGATHLLFEKDFRPVLELRWQKGKTHTKKSIEATLHTIAEETGLLVQKSPPAHWKNLLEPYSFRLLADNETRELTAAILICKECSTTLLLYFFHDTATKNHRELTQVISSISCHVEKESTTSLWAIQDFRVHVPKTFTLTGHNFGAGLSRISFIDSGLTMHLCRIAGAEQRLRNSSMTTLMNILGELEINEDEIIHQDNLSTHSSSPSIFQQIRSRLKRKPPFHLITLRHHPEYDRLTGLFFFDKKPIPEKQSTTILESYEIFQI